MVGHTVAGSVADIIEKDAHVFMILLSYGHDNIWILKRRKVSIRWECEYDDGHKDRITQEQAGYVAD